MYKIYDKTTDEVYYTRSEKGAIKMYDYLIERAFNKYLAKEEPVTIEIIKK